MSDLWFTSADGRIELTMSLEEAQSVSHQGECEDDTRALMRVPHIKAQLDKLTHNDVANELRQTGAWDDADLADEDMSLVRLLWLAGCDIADRAFMDADGEG